MSSFLVRIKIWKFLSKRSIFMPVAKEQIWQIITDNNLNSVADVYRLPRVVSPYQTNQEAP